MNAKEMKNIGKRIKSLMRKPKPIPVRRAKNKGRPAQQRPENMPPIPPIKLFVIFS